MGVERCISPKSLAVRFNGKFSPTDRGHYAHELVRIHRTLKNEENPKVQFSMTNELKQMHLERKEELCSKLGLPADEKIREKAIQGYDGYLRRVGFPYYVINLK